MKVLRRKWKVLWGLGANIVFSKQIDSNRERLMDTVRCLVLYVKIAGGN